jgi:mitochondrial import inner membrane translocase subunit TIM16
VCRGKRKTDSCQRNRKEKEYSHCIASIQRRLNGCHKSFHFADYIHSQAHRIITQIVVTGTRVFGRAFAEAYKQASASSKYAADARKNGGSSGPMNTFASSGLTLDEACKILNVKPPQGGEANIEHVMERFKKLFDLNDPEKGGSFYLQSKILRARERIEMEVREATRKAKEEKELREGWKPKVYKDR